MIWSVDNNMKLNNKGFTLIELLAVFVILISVSFVAVGGITSSLDKQDERDCENQKDIAISAAKMYFSLDGKGDIQVDVSDLVSAGYINDKDKICKVTDGYVRLNGNVYEYIGNCDGSCN